MTIITLIFYLVAALRGRLPEGAIIGVLVAVGIDACLCVVAVATACN